MKKTSVFIFSIIIYLTMMPPAYAKSAAEKAALEGLTAVTVFIDISRFSRKNGAAEKMTESHRDFAQFGYRLVAVNPYTENSDLEGFFVSYQKPQRIDDTIKYNP